MLFRKKKTESKAELDLHVFQTKVELKRLQEKYQTLLERELRTARREKEGGAAQPANYERIKTIYYLLQTTENAYQELDDISTADELNRTTNELSKALDRVNQLAAVSQRADTRNLRKGVAQIDDNEALLQREYEKQSRIVKNNSVAAGKYDSELVELLGEVPPMPQVTLPTTPAPGTGGEKQVLKSDEELAAEMDAINRQLNSILEDF